MTSSRAPRATRSRRLRWTATLLPVLSLVLIPQAGASGGPGVDGPVVADVAHSNGAAVTTLETGCHEVALPRQADYAQLDAVVPDRYVLLETAPGFGRLVIYDVVCEAVSVNGQSGGPTTVMLAVAEFSQRDGRDERGFYVLAHGTNNPELAASYQALGLPTQFQPGTTGTASSEDGRVTAQWNVVGEGLDHTVAATYTSRRTERSTTEGRFYFESGSGRAYRSDYVNRMENWTVQVRADFTTASALVPLISPARLTTIPPEGLSGTGTFRTGFIGDMTSRLTACPPPTTPGQPPPCR